MNKFYISDTHFFHANILKFTNKWGKPMRPFASLDEMHGTLIKNWNSTVSPNDIVYHLGDVAFGNVENLKILHQLNGKKILVRGNHDRHSTLDYLEYFEEIEGVFYKDKIIFSHIPISEDTFYGGRFIGNVHGHIHDNETKSRWYKNISVEAINYTPIAHEELIKSLSKNLTK